MTNEERKEFYMNRNIKIYPTYLAFVWDLLFVWTISTMFFTNQKGLTYSQVISLDTVLMFSACIMCIPVTKLFSKFTPIKALRIGCLGYIVALLIWIFGSGYFMIALSQVFIGFAYCVLSVKGNPLLTDSLHAVKRDKDYGRIYGKGLSIFYVLEAVGAVGVTFVYTFNPYLAIWIAMGIVVVAELMSFLFVEPAKFQKQNVELSSASTQTKTEETAPKKKEIQIKTSKLKQLFNDAKKEQTDSVKDKKQTDSYFKILSSGFVISLLLYSFMFRGVVAIDTGSFKIYLQMLLPSEGNTGIIPIWAFGCIYGIMKVCVALSNKFQFKYNLKFGVRSLIIFNFLLIASFIINAVMFIISPTSIITIVVIIISSCIQCSLRTPNQIFINNYIQVCLPNKNLEKLYALNTMIQYLGYALMSAVFSGLMSAFSNNYGLSIITYMAIFTIPLIISLIVFLRLLCKKYASKYTIIKQEYVEDEF